MLSKNHENRRKAHFKSSQAVLVSLFICLVLAQGGWGLSQENSSAKLPKAKWGDPAKPLALAEWVKGKPLDLKKMKGKKIVVLDFWTTGNQSNLGNIAQLSQLQKKYESKGVVFAGISSELPQTVRSFIEKKGAKMDYAVAVDNNYRTSKAYLGAYGVKAPPHTFVIDKKGMVVWHGHLMEDLNRVLSAILDGTYSMKDARRSYEKREKAKVLVTKYFDLVTQPGNEAEAKKVGEEILKTGDETPRILNLLSYNILAYPKVLNPDRKLALRAAHLALELTKEKDVEILDTYARALFDTGDSTAAIKYQKKAFEITRKALESTKDKGQKALLQKSAMKLRKTLEKYETKPSNAK